MRKMLLAVLLLSFIPNGAFSKSPTMSYSQTVLVSSLAHDSDKLFVGTPYGLIIIEKHTGKQMVATINSEAERQVSAMAIQGDTLWVGGERATLSYYANGSIHSFQPLIFLNTSNTSHPHYTPLEDIDFTTVTSITFSPSTGKLYGAFCNYFGEVSETVECHALKTGVSFLEGDIQDTEADSFGNIWLYSNCYGSLSLLKYSEENGLERVLDNYTNDDIDIPSITWTKDHLGGVCMAIDAEDHVWLGSMTGHLIEYDGESFQVYSPPLAQRQTLSDLAFDENGILWMLSHNGTLIRFDGKDFEARQLDMLEGEVVYCMDIDGDTIYAGTNKRVIAYSDGTQESIELKIASSVHTVTKSSDAAPALHDLQGRRLSGVPERGVYIENGRKRVVR